MQVHSLIYTIYVALIKRYTYCEALKKEMFFFFTKYGVKFWVVLTEISGILVDKNKIAFYFFVL